MFFYVGRGTLRESVTKWLAVHGPWRGGAGQNQPALGQGSPSLSVRLHACKLAGGRAGGLVWFPHAKFGQADYKAVIGRTCALSSRMGPV